jgi:ER-bound oxygenase mpaB/B'/Rubber oxygenase, catalytic domain
VPQPSDRYLRALAALDPLADNLAAAFAELPAGRGRVLLETALNAGMDAVTDPPQALIDLFTRLDDVPLWVDWDRLERGGRLLLRSGLLGIAVLNLYSIPLMYSSAAGVKPLMFTGQLLRRAPRRLAETARFVVSTCRPGGLRRFADGFKVTVKVRLMHSQVRRLLWQSGKWKPEWGEPINQIYMAGTNVALSVILIDGLRRFGFRVSRDEAEAILHLWRYSGYLSGVDPQLLCSTEAEGWQLVNLIRDSEGPPDADFRSLLEAVMSASYLPQVDKLAWRTSAGYGLSRSLIGDELADALGFPRSWGWQWALRTGYPVVAFGDLLQRAIPGGRAWATGFGMRTWDKIIDQILAGGRAEFHAPAQLDNQPVHEEPQ